MIGRGGPYLSALAQCELEGFGWTWSSSGVSDCAFPISLNVFGIVAVVLDSLKPRHHGKVPYPRRGNRNFKDTKHRKLTELQFIINFETNKFGFNKDISFLSKYDTFKH